MVPLGARCCGEGQTLAGDRCVGKPARCAEGLVVTEAGCVARPRATPIEAGVLRIGPSDWEAQGQVTPRVVTMEAFAIDAYEVTEARYAACVAASACAPVPLSEEPGRALSRVTLAEARAFCAWAGGMVPTPEELAFAAAGAKGRRYAWGDTGAVCRRAAWGLVGGPCGAGATGPEVAGSHPDGASPEGAHDLAGNVAEWAAPRTSEAVGPELAEARGGSFGDGAASALRSWNRLEIAASTRSAEVGFRCVYPFAAAAEGGALAR
ncbi:SUMF1/EgtB/PvdO family nonheme iron enzyme [Polyangium spumosum]|uniref:SUMF1/EgtB/PvdO family nonheme iron enzyme n=2 Tax=Polyangium spumosum TaxID=889282 RepID=A0A6N7PVY1_9BACT|nr:SUMF1/EgtB/PvdO family nonheme iron enzyme [Polyangium spumosum]MRG94600.1 SUMF1/EgtB/PvdO family nonheme iron enzyme [Polyangium spumosum]